MLTNDIVMYVVICELCMFVILTFSPHHSIPEILTSFTSTAVFMCLAPFLPILIVAALLDLIIHRLAR